MKPLAWSFVSTPSSVRIGKSDGKNFNPYRSKVKSDSTPLCVVLGPMSSQNSTALCVVLGPMSSQNRQRFALY